MQVRIINSIVGHGWTHNVGEVLTLDAAAAARLIEAGVAELVKVAESIETATLNSNPAETATAKPAKPRRKAVQS